MCTSRKLSIRTSSDYDYTTRVKVSKTEFFSTKVRKSLMNGYLSSPIIVSVSVSKTLTNRREFWAQVASLKCSAVRIKGLEMVWLSN